jgi:hypothetical protein
MHNAHLFLGKGKKKNEDRDIYIYIFHYIIGSQFNFQTCSELFQM